MMKGKILKIQANDLYGNVDDREVCVFASFNHKKYMNKYVIFTFKDEYGKKKLYYGSIHLKKDSLVVFSVRQEVVRYIDEFVNSYLENRLDNNEYELIDIDKLKKIELVSYNEKEFDKLEELDRISIVRNENSNDIKEIDGSKRPVFLYIILVMLIVMLGGLTLLYLKPELFMVEMKKLTCDIDGYHEELKLHMRTHREITFDKNDKLRDISVVDNYQFVTEEEYLEFKNNNRQDEYFGSSSGGYKYDDENYLLKIIYTEKSIIDDYREMFNYLKNEGYSCIEGTYYE